MDDIFKYLLVSPETSHPHRGSPCSAGWDLPANDSGVIYSGKQTLIGTGIVPFIPHGYYGQIAPRSGLAMKKRIQVLGGIIDSDYRGEIKVILHNGGCYNFEYRMGDRIAQLLILPCMTTEAMEISAEELESIQTARGTDGFGSTGISKLETKDIFQPEGEYLNYAT